MTDTPRTEEEIVEIGARAHFDAAGRVRYGRAAPDWDRHLTERNREQGRAEFRELLSRLRAAGLAVEQGWQPIETAPRDGTRILGYFPEQIEGAIICETYRVAGFESDPSSGWWACPTRFFHQPTHWRPLPAAPSQENTDAAHPADRRK